MFFRHQGPAHTQCEHCCRHAFLWFRRNETCNRPYVTCLALPKDSVFISHSSGVSYLMIVIFPCRVLDSVMSLMAPALMVTCARIPMSALQGDAISVISDPMPGQSRGKIPRILVLYGGSVLWSLPVDDCQTWFVSALAL